MRKFNTLSLILGIVGLVTSFLLIGLIPSIVALIFGVLHITKIRKSIGKTIAGIACASIGLFISLILIITIAVPSSNSNNNKDYSDESYISDVVDPSIESTTEVFTEKQTESPTEKQTEPPMEKQTEPPTEKQTEPPTEKQTEPPTEKQTEPPTEMQTEPPQTSQTLVWIVEDGTRYHCKSTCSNMRSPYQVSIETAQSYGLTACKRCY